MRQLCVAVIEVDKIYVHHLERGVEMTEFDTNKEVKTMVDNLFREQLKIEDMEQIYRQTVLLSMNVAKELSARRHLLPSREDINVDPAVYPPCRFKRHVINDEVIFQLSFDGMLPLYDKDNKFTAQIKDYYTLSTLEAIRNESISCFDHGFIYACHFFENLVVRDLDNRNRRLLINAIRYAGFIKDDSWEHVEIMESGFLDIAKSNHIEVFIGSQQNGLKMVKYVNEKYRKGHDFSG